MKESELPIFVEWMEFSKWLLTTTEKFPKRARFTYTARIEDAVLDIAQDLTEARYAKAGEKLAFLQGCNMKLERLRIVLRLCHDMKIMSHSSHEHAAKKLFTIGSALGGWIAQQKGTKNETLRLSL